MLRKRKSGDLPTEEPPKRPGPAVSRRAKAAETPALSERTSSPRSLRSSPVTTEKPSRSSPLLPPHTQPQVLVKPVRALPETRIIRDFKDKVRERDKLVWNKPKRQRVEPDSRPSRDTSVNSQSSKEETDKGEDKDKPKKDKSDKDTSDKKSAISPRPRRTDESRVTRDSVQRLRRDENQRKASPDTVSPDSSADKDLKLATSPAEGLRSHSKSSKASEPSKSSLHSTSSGGSIVSQPTAVISGENSGTKAAASPASPSPALGSSTTHTPPPTLPAHKHWQTPPPHKARQSSPSPKPPSSPATSKPPAVSSAAPTQNPTPSIVSCPKPQETELTTKSQEPLTLPPKKSPPLLPTRTAPSPDPGPVSQSTVSVKPDPVGDKTSNVSKPVESPSSKDGRPSSAGCEVKPEPPEPAASEVQPECADSEVKPSTSQVKPAAVKPAEKQGEHTTPKAALCRSSESNRGRSLVRASSSNSLLSSARSKDGEESSKMHFKKMHLLGDGFHNKKEDDGDKDSFSSDSSGINVNHSLTDQLAKRAKPPESLGWNNNHVGASPALGMEPGSSYPGQNGGGEGPFSPREADRSQKSRDYEPARPASASQSVPPRPEEAHVRPLSPERRSVGPIPSARGEESRLVRLDERHALLPGMVCRMDEFKRHREGGPASSSPLVFDKNEPVRVYRDPELLKQDEFRMQHTIPARPTHPSPAPRTSPSYSGVHTHPSPLSAHHALAAQHAANPLLSPLQYRQGVSPLSPHMSLPSPAIDSRMADHATLRALNAQQQAHLLPYSGAHLMAAAAYSGSLHPSLQTAQLELLWQHKYPTLPVPPAWMLAQYQDELLRDVNLIALERERRERELAMERDRAERDRAEREKAERDRQER